ncbi:MAG: ABC transporter ATP-binding protein [Bacteroidales bacterium]|nr:ABC transporter ATP-binding protein [Bacteroidales bacterium]MCF8454558.1 ABC transporter ATP-binding protein [Bacteroidales bacterium]
METLLQTRELSKIFRTDEVETVALNKVSLDIQKGEFVAVMGPSGCGKSTLLNILGMLDNPSNGKYFFQNEEVSTYKERKRSLLRKANIGFVFQNFNLIDELNVYENVELPLIYLGIGSHDRKAKVEEALEKMNMTHRQRSFPLQLSGGQQQRVAVARAVVANPSLILADEPTGNLDSTHGEEVMNLLESLNRNGTTIVIVTHSERDADYSQRIIRLFDGKIIHENFFKQK